MPVTLLVVQGPYVGQQIQVGAGQTFRIGRTDRSEYAFPNDTYLSGAHLEVACDEQECRIRDLGSSNGTFVNGVKIDLAAVQEGDQVSAGETVFLVQMAGQEQAAAAPTPAVEPPDGAQLPVAERTARMFAPGFEPKAEEQLAPLTPEGRRALHILTHHGAPLFTVVDAACDGKAQELVQSSRLRSQALFEGETADPPATHTPTLVELGQAGSQGVGKEVQAFLETLLRSGWGRNWGIFCTSPSPFEAVLEHFRSFLLVRTREQRPLYFRFYDPRVLRAFLPTCEPQELSALFGPVTSYLVESERPDMMLAFSCGAEGLITSRVLLAEQSMLAQAGASQSA
ncbi:MAG: DUF4123 domain-containing protein [Acidobacteriia bacterium]|nr:DUF4123 domain-containing protein [Terriglobia bacterium]